MACQSCNNPPPETPITASELRHDPVCVLGENDWCERHQTKHVGWQRDMAMNPGPEGAKYRQLWDRKKKLWESKS
ncbi:MAG: hypothetical protein KGJ13_06895 [Patescibacteria group bacterium]|nr:hypothetical protein [Patescibacteria group bacterium]